MIDLVEAWSERAAICEFDGGLPRHQAETQATIEACHHRRLRGLPFGQVLGAMLAAEKGDYRGLRALMGG